MKLTPFRQATKGAAFNRFIHNWRVMLGHSPDAGQPTQADVWASAWDAATTFERERAKNNLQGAANTFELNELN